jgi:hypothetical protein
MKEINVIKAFLLTLADHTKRAFAVGIHKVEDEIADHWFVKAHSEPVAAVAPAVEPEPTPVPTPVVVPVVEPVVEAAPVEAVAKKTK